MRIANEKVKGPGSKGRGTHGLQIKKKRKGGPRLSYSGETDSKVAGGKSRTKGSRGGIELWEERVASVGVITDWSWHGSVFNCYVESEGGGKIVKGPL